MDVSHFGLFNVTSGAPRQKEPPPGAQAIGIGPGVNDNDRAGRRPLRRPQWTLLRFLPGRAREPGPA